MTNQFDNKGDGDQNIAQGLNAIGKQVNNYYGISEERFDELKDQLSITDLALRNFFKILEENQVSRDDLDAKLREIAAQYKELLTRLETVQSEDQEVVRLKEEARQTIEAGRYAEAEELLNRAEARDIAAIEELDKQADQIAQAARQRRISATISCVDNAKLQAVQLRYAQAAEYWQRAATLLPEEEEQNRAKLLSNAAYNLLYLAKYKDALTLYGQSLIICREIDDRAEEGKTLNNIGEIYRVQGYYDNALKYLKQSLSICRELGSKEGKSAILNNIGLIYQTIGDYTVALEYFKQSLAASQEIDNKEGEAATLNNISLIYKIRGDHSKALFSLGQSLTICKDLGNKKGEATALMNIGQLYDIQGNSTVALKYLKQSLTICQDFGDQATEGRTLNAIGQIYKEACNNSPAALRYFEQSLTIQREIGDREGEAVTNWNISFVYIEQHNLSRAEQHISLAVQLAEAIGHPSLKKYRQGLKEIRAYLRGK